ncbi:MAG: GNAT family N-acetyltransferase [candidate division FCPU426 bacterium]
MPENDPIVIEPLQTASLGEFARLIRLFFEETKLEPEFHRYDQDVTAPLTYYVPPRNGAWFLRPKTGLPAAGLVALRSLANRTCEIKRLYVLQEERGKGYGQRLLSQAMNFARLADYFEILLSVRPEQKIALKLYEQNGFHPCARYHPDRRAGIFYSYKFTEEGQ